MNGYGRCIILFLLIVFFPTYSYSQTRAARVGMLIPGSPESCTALLEGFREELRHNGYIEGQNLTIVARFVPDDPDVATAAAELIDSGVDVIVASSFPAIVAAENATITIPIVFVFKGDAVRSGFVKSLERPGGNLTGVTISESEMIITRMTLLKEIVPSTRRLAVIGNWAAIQSAGARKIIETTAQRLGIEVLFARLESTNGIAGFFAAARDWSADSYMTLAETMTTEAHAQIAGLAAMDGRPLVLHGPEGVNTGALMSISEDDHESFRMAAIYVAKILQGAPPEMLPVARNNKPKFVLNLTAAKTLGATIKPAILARTAKTIQ